MWLENQIAFMPYAVTIDISIKVHSFSSFLFPVLAHTVVIFAFVCLFSFGEMLSWHNLYINYT